MENDTFFYAYEGQQDLHFAIDCMDRYKTLEFDKFENYISRIDLNPAAVVSLLQSYQVNVKGDVIYSGSQNDMRYFLVNTKRNFEGLIDGFGNNRVALLCQHYEETDNLVWDELTEYSQTVYKPLDRVARVSVNLMNYYQEPFTKEDIELIELLLKKLEKMIGMKLGVCIPLDMDWKNKRLVSIDTFSKLLFRVL